MNTLSPKMRAILNARTAPAIVHMAAYANAGLTPLIPSLYEGLDVVSRELVGFIPGVARSAATERAAVGQSVVYHVAPPASTFNVTPAMTVPEPTDQTLTSGSLTITKSKGAEFGYTGEEQRGLNTGAGYVSVQGDQFAQGLRALTNEIELDLAIAATAAASRATGTAGTTPFATNLADAAQLRKILDDNGAPPSGRSLVMGTTAGAAVRTLTQLTKANEAGTLMTLRQGELLDVFGMSLKESGQSVNKVKGTGTAYTSTAAGFAIGATSIPLITGSGTVLAGDVVSFAGDPNKYVVATGVAAPGTIVLAAPGLRQAIPAVATALTIGNNYAANVAFSSNALVLAARAPALPEQGDAAIDRRTIVDVRSGISFEVSMYAVYRKVRLEVALSWGVKAVKPEHIALLLG